MIHDQSSDRLIRINPPVNCCDEVWEAAYLKFETPEKELLKFLKRLKKLGVDQLSRDSSVVDIFCGRGNGLLALQHLGFRNLEGLDLSEHLLKQCQANATLYVCDCRKLPFADESRDLVIVQGGLHHLPELPDDLRATITEISRVLKPGGRFVMVEPWLTPFLTFVHGLCRMPIATKYSGTIEALATMIDRERVTYENWLSRGAEINALLTEQMEPVINRNRWGKKLFVGHPK